MAAPAVSGVLALIQDFFTNTLGQMPSPALLKAMVINGAQSVGSYQIAVTNSPNDEGWGLVSLPGALPAGLTNQLSNPTNTPLYFQDQSATNALGTGDSQTFQLTVPPNAQGLPLKVTLVWTDPPGDPAAAFKLVNNLDIIVTNIDATNVYFGNNFASAGNPTYSLAAGTNPPPVFDVVNNVRNIFLQPPLNTNYTVTVLGRSVNVNAVTAQTNGVVQDFALVISAGDGSVSNGVHVVASPVVTNPTGDQDITFVTTTNVPLLNQIVGENSPLLGTNTVMVGTNSPLSTNGLVTVGMTNQWHFYVVTNTLGYTNAAFILFNPDELAVARLGTLAATTADATRPEADIDLYVATDPATGAGGTLTNLDPVVISNCVNSVGNYRVSAGPGGTEFVAFSNSVQNQVYYIGVKSEDHLGATYGFLPVFSEYPFSSMNADGSESVNGLTLPAAILPGSPQHAKVVLVFALALYPLAIDEVIVTNQVWHQNSGNLYGQVGHNQVYTMLDSHDGYENTIGSSSIIYYDAAANPINTPIGPVTVPAPHPTDGPGSLTAYRTQQAIGPWILAEADNVPYASGNVMAYGLRIYPHQQPDKGLNVYIAGQSAYYDYIDVPAGVTNLTLSVTNETVPPDLINPLQVYLRFGADPTPTATFPPTVYDQMGICSNGTPPGCSLSVGASSIPPIQPGRYFYEIYNPSLSPATNVYILATLQYAAVSSGAVFTAPKVPVALQDDAAVTNSIVITNTETIFSAAVGVVLNSPRVSDLTLTLVSPLGQRYTLFENRGGLNATNLGHLNITTNFFGNVSSGSQLGDTNVLGPVPSEGVLLINYNMYTVPDDLAVYYGGVKIFDSGYISFTGEFSIPYGPGTATNITIVMDQGGDAFGSSLWTYTPEIVAEDYTYLTFTSDTNLAQTPIKFAVPPFDLTDYGSNYTLCGFEPATNGDYLAPTNIYDLYGGWNLYTNLPGTGTNILMVTNNQVSVVTDPASAYEGSNFLALAKGTIERVIPTTPNREYTVSYSYRGPGIAGWWRGEGNGSDSSDPETNGNNGRLIGRFTFPGGEVGQAFEMAADGQLYDFAGTNNYVQVPQSHALDVGVGSGFTVEGWINPTNLYTQEPLVEWLSRMPTNAAVTNIQILAGPFLNRGTGHYYYLLGATNWTTSERWATNMGGHLATIVSANLQNWVFDTFADYGGTNRNLWIGLNDAADPGSNVWSSGVTNVAYSNWLPGEPTNCSGNAFYTLILGATNAEPGLWTKADDSGATCGSATNRAYGVVELYDIPTNGVQLWVSVTNSPATGNGILSSNGCLYANLVDTTNGFHEIWSFPGLVQSNLWQHVALTYNTNTGVASLFYDGTNVCSTNLGVFTPKTTGDVLLGKDMSRLTNNYYSGEMDEMSVYRRCLSDSEILAIYQISALFTNSAPTNGIVNTPGKFDPLLNPAIGLAEAVVTLGGRTSVILGDNTNWQRVSYTFIATSNSVPLQITGLEPGMLLDDFTVAETELGNLYYQPEQPLDPLVGEVAAGVWTLEILDNRANDTNFPAQLVSWQLQFQLQTNTPVPITLGPQTPATNTVPPGQIAYFYVPVPDWATNATNIIVSSPGLMSLLYNPTNPPTGLNPGDFTLFTLPAGQASGQTVLVTNTTSPYLPTNFYYLGVQNNGPVPASFVVRVDFNITALSNSVPVTDTLTTNDDVRYFSFVVSTNHAYEATFQLLQLSGNANLVVNYGTPLPNLTNAEYGSFNVSNLDQSIYVLTNSLPVHLAPGTWYLGVFRNQPGPVRYTVLAKELDMTATEPSVIPLTNNVPFNFTTGPGAALTNFFSFYVTNSPAQVHFALFNLTGNGDLVVQSNALPFAPPWYQSSQEPARIPEYIYLRTNSVLTNLDAMWYLGVPNHETNLIHYTILAVVDTNMLPAFPGAVGAGGYTAGGRGSTNVYHVINLNDDGPGSLRYGVNTLTNSATILFDVSGNIPLQSPLVITNSYLTIAGQTAPGDGITLQNYPTLLSGAHDVIIRYLRFRPGDSNTNTFLTFTNVVNILGTNVSQVFTNITPGDALSFTNAANVILDHVSASWSTNAVVEVLNSTNVTVQWSVIADSLYSTNGRAGQGSLLRYGNGALSFNHDLYADNYTASPLLSDNLTLDFVNNVIYNWGQLAGESLTNDPVAYPNGSTNELNYAGNYLIATTNSMTNYIAFWIGNTNTWIFQTNNFIDSNTNYVFRAPLDGAPTGWAMFTNVAADFGGFGEPFVLAFPPVTNATLPTANAEEAYQAYEDVLDFAGAQLARDRVDERLIWNVRNQTNVQFLASQTNAGGWPVLRTSPQPLDTDQDGLPDYWKITFGLSLTNAMENLTNITASGYSQLETYLNWLAGPHALTSGTNPVSVNLYQLAGRTGRLSFCVTNAINGLVALTNEVYTNTIYTNGLAYTNVVVTWTNTVALFTPTNNYTSSFTNPASFDFYVTNNDTVAWFGPVTVSVVVSATNIMLTPAIIDLTNGVPYTLTNAGPVVVLTNLFRFTPTNSPGGVVFELYAITNGSANLVVQTNRLPVPPDYFLSTAPGSNSQVVLVQTNPGLTGVSSAILANLNTQWYLGVPNDNATTNSISYTIMAEELPASPNIITLTNGVPFTFTAGPGPDLTNFFLFNVTNSPAALQFQLYNLSGNGDLTVQTNALPFAPLFYQISQQPNNNPEFIQVTTNNGGPASLNAPWYLGVPNNAPGQITYTILAQEITNTPPAVIATNSPLTNIVSALSTNFYLVDVPQYAVAATNTLLFANGPVYLWYSTNLPPTIGSPNDALLLGNATNGAAVFDTNGTAQLSGTALLVPGGFYYLGLANTNNFPVTNALEVSFLLIPPGIAAPTVTNLPAINITPYGATLEASVTPNGDPTTVYFEYGLTNRETNFTTTVLLTNSLFSPWPVAIDITGLLPGNTYYCEAIGTNDVGAATNALNGAFTTPAAPPFVTTVAATNLAPTGATLQALVNPNGAATSVYFAYGTNASYGSYSTTNVLISNLNTAQLLTNDLTGLERGVIYHFRAIGANSAGTTFGADLTFTNLTEPPSVTTVGATDITPTGAKLLASVNPNGAVATVYFAYGTTTNYDNVSFSKLLSTNLNGVQSVALGVGGLLPGVLYHYQAVGFNNAGTNYGQDLTFATPIAAPTVITLAATNVLSTNATVEALVTPNGDPATVYFEYGPTTNYGGSSGTIVLTGGLDSAQLVTNVLAGLQPGVNYHFQAVAYNSAGTNYGGDLTLIPPVPPPVIFFTSIIATNNGYLLSWYAPTNDQFRVLWTASLTTGSWNAFTNIVVYTGPFTTTNGLFTFFDDGSQTGGFGATRFYRFELLPPVLPPSGAVYRVNPLATLVVNDAAIYSSPNASLSYAVSGTLPGTNQPSVGLNTGIVSWTPTLAQAGLTNAITIILTENGQIPQTVTNSFTAIVNPIPFFTSVQVTAEGVMLQWAAAANDQFQVGWTTNLLTPWNYVPANPPYLTSPFTNFFYQDLTPMSSMKFYRLRQLP